jgi:hypothetical protein
MVQNMTAQEKVRDAAHEMADSLRWNRMDIAVQRVAPAYQQRFAEARRDWGRVIQIADAELVSLTMGENRSEAVSTLAVRWYNQRTMTVREAVLQQKWTRLKGGFYLVEETVVHGDPNLLASPPKPLTERAAAASPQG